MTHIGSHHTGGWLLERRWHGKGITIIHRRRLGFDGSSTTKEEQG
jgi:hypothetical protein